MFTLKQQACIVYFSSFNILEISPVSNICPYSRIMVGYISSSVYSLNWPENPCWFNIHF